MSAIVENVSLEEKREALDLVFRSQTFSRSDRLKNLLRFICEAEIEGRPDDLNEYAIGIGALGRPMDFSPGEDSSVRSRAYELRRKLEKLYASEAPDAQVRVAIPKGSYLPQFSRAGFSEQQAAVELPAVSTVAPDDAIAPPAGVERRLKVVPLLIAFAAGVVLTAAAFSLWMARASRSQPAHGAWTRDLETIWKPMLDSNAPILVSFQTRLFLRAGPLNVRDWTVDTISGVEGSKYLMSLKQFFNVPQLYENRDYVDFGAANAVFQLSRLLATRKQNIFAKRSSDVTWDDLKANNVIIIGKPEADPTVSHWLARGKFLEVGGRIVNLQPAPGELNVWADDEGDGAQKWKQKYALVTMMRGPGEANWVMSMSGSGSEHPWAMADYFTNPEHARDLVKHLSLASGKLPPVYQVVIRAEFKSQTPVKVGYVAHRALNNF
jgi:hypothetical protein